MVMSNKKRGLYSKTITIFQIPRLDINPYHHWSCLECGATMFTFYVKKDDKIKTKQDAINMLMTYLYNHNEYTGEYKHKCVNCFFKDLATKYEV